MQRRIQTVRQPAQIAVGIHTILPIKLARICTRETGNLHQDGQEHIVVHSIDGANNRCSCTACQHRNHHLHQQSQRQIIVDGLDKTTSSCVMYDTYHSSVPHSPQGKSNFKNSCSKDTNQDSNQNGEKKYKKEILRQQVPWVACLSARTQCPETPCSEFANVFLERTFDLQQPCKNGDETQNKCYPGNDYHHRYRQAIEGLPCSSHVNIPPHITL
jgi:hypothetical protein